MLVWDVADKLALALVFLGVLLHSPVGVIPQTTFQFVGAYITDSLCSNSSVSFYTYEAVQANILCF
jgi:hypothetical protein